MVKKEGKEVIYDCRYFDNRLPPKDRLVKTGHQTLGQGQMYAIRKSEDFGYCEVAEVLQYNVGTVPQEDVVKRWAYLNGQEVDINVDYAAEKEKFIAAAHKKLMKLETETQVQAAKAGKDVTKENEMDNATVTSADVKKATKGKAVTKVGAAAAKNAKTTTKAFQKPNGKAPAKKVAPKAKKEATAPLGKPGSLLAQFGARAESNRGNMLQLLCDNVGKMLAVKDVLKATYGSPNTEKVGALKMVIKGAEEMIRANKIDCHIARGEDAKGDLTLGIKKGKAAKE